MDQPAVYYTLTIENLDAKLEDLVSGLCFEFEAQGVSQKLAFEQAGDHYEPVTVAQEKISLQVYFLSPPDEKFRIELSSMAPEATISITEDENKDWMEEWKKGFHEFELVDNIWVVPSWKTAPENVRAVISMDPGMAFGTGTHETTQIASELLHKHIGLDSPKSLLDVGTGTGLLALLAEILGVVELEATEIVDLARQVAKENIELNKSKSVKILDYQIEKIDRQYDMVMANIIDGVLIDIQSELLRCLADGKKIILTGILKEREKQFKERFQLPESYAWIDRIQKGEWVGLVGGPK